MAEAEHFENDSGGGINDDNQWNWIGYKGMIYMVEVE